MNKFSRENGISSNLIVGLSRAAVVAGFLFCANGGFAQTLSTQSASSIDVAQPTQPDSIVQLTAEAQGLSLVNPSDLPPCGTFWVVTADGNLSPDPCPVFDQSLPVYAITDTAFLVDSTGGEVSTVLADGETVSAETALTNLATVVVNLINQVQTADANQQARPMMLASAMSMDVPSPDDGGDTNVVMGDALSSFTPLNLVSSTNLWLAITNLANGMAGLMLSNTIADVQYEIQAETNLTGMAASNWTTVGTVLGSELTNWTPTSVAATNQPTLFLRVRSDIDSENIGIPDWWQLQYFGYVGIDPNGDPMGDGWSNAQKYKYGMNPNVFYTPPAPQGLTVTYNSVSATAAISWLPSPGPVTGYTVADSDGNNFNFSSSSLSFTDNVSTDGFTYLGNGPTIGTTYMVQAHYAGGNSAWSAPVPLENNSLQTFASSITDIAPTPINPSVRIIPGPQGTAYLAVSALPSGTVALKLTEVDDYDQDNATIVTNFSVSISSFTNGLCLIPNISTPPDANQHSVYVWYAQLVDANNNLSASSWASGNYGIPYQTYDESGNGNSWLVPPYFDGRQQIKQNLIYQLRAATAGSPFNFADADLYGSTPYYPNTTNYVYAGYYQFQPFDFGNGIIGSEVTFDAGLPFEENYLYRNFVYNSSELDSNGRTTTGAGGSYSDPEGGLLLEEPALYEFPPTTNGATITALLATNQTQWLASFPLDSSGSSYMSQIGITLFGSTNIMAANALNYFGLPFKSAKIAYNGGNITLNAGNSTTQTGYFYPETTQPQFQLVEYDFWPTLPFPSYELTNSVLLPGFPGLPAASVNPLIISSVGQTFQVSGWAKLAVTNSYYSGVYGYLGQYFDKAYQITNGVVTTNQTGVLSPYGSFFATQPGQAALVTMPDLDTGARGTCTVYSVSINLDANHDGTMDTSFNGPDQTSPSSPYVFWCNNNFDRWDNDFPFFTAEQDDQQSAAQSDCNFSDSFGDRLIPCTRDLEDFARLWISGVTSNLLAMLPIGSSVTLSWGDVGNPNQNNPTIDLFTAADADGGIGYLTNETTATAQTNISTSVFIGRLGPGGSIQLNTLMNQLPTTHFVWCGVTNGSGQLNLIIQDGNGNVLAQASQWIQIMDIKNMYERWTVGDNANTAPASTATLEVNDMPAPPQPAFQYTAPQNTNTPYILLVHGYNMAIWEKDAYAQTAFKRLYWQGYQGRFGVFNWPTAANAVQFGNSELQAWNSGLGLLNKLNDLNSIYPGKVYLLAHSLGNVVAGEALRLAGSSRVVNTYIAMQGAVAAHAYDPTTATYNLGVFYDGAPDCYAHYWTNGMPSFFNASAGAGTYVNFFNVNDWALTNAWLPFQDAKPTLNPSYSYNPVTGAYYKNFGITQLFFPANTYELFANFIQAPCYALGMQPNVAGAFKVGGAYNQIELDSVPYNFGPQHIYHSGEFRSDNAQRWQFWNQALVQMKLK